MDTHAQDCLIAREVDNGMYILTHANVLIINTGMVLIVPRFLHVLMDKFLIKVIVAFVQINIIGMEPLVFMHLVKAGKFGLELNVYVLMA